VRFIEAFVDSLDLDALGCRRVQPATTGRPSSHPGGLLTLYLCGSRHRIRPSRRLEQETPRHVARLWLLRNLHPDVKTMADFRTDPAPAFKHVFRAFTRRWKEWGLLGAALVATDGRQVKAVTHKPRDVTRATRRDRLHAVDAQPAHYLRALDAADAAAAAVPAREARGERQLSLTDPDSRARPKSPKVGVGDNVPTAVDAKHTPIVAQHVTRAVTDAEQLRAMAMAAPETLGVEHLQVVAAMGDDHGEDSNAWEAAGLEPDRAKPWTSATRKVGPYGQARFRDDPVHGAYHCPAGRRVTCRVATVEQGRPRRSDATTAGRTGVIRAPGPRNTEGRRMTRWVPEHRPEKRRQRVEAHPGVMKPRQQSVEHPCGTIKQWNDHAHFLVRGLTTVRAEMRLSALAYNRKRVSPLLGVPALTAAVTWAGRHPRRRGFGKTASPQWLSALVSPREQRAEADELLAARTSQAKVAAWKVCFHTVWHCSRRLRASATRPLSGAAERWR
jgi:transposase